MLFHLLFVNSQFRAAAFFYKKLRQSLFILAIIIYKPKYIFQQSSTGHLNQIYKATGRQITTYNKPISSNHPKKMLKFVPLGSQKAKWRQLKTIDAIFLLPYNNILTRF